MYPIYISVFIYLRYISVVLRLINNIAIMLYRDINDICAPNICHFEKCFEYNYTPKDTAFQ
jgi:hypothetical protein